MPGGDAAVHATGRNQQCVSGPSSSSPCSSLSGCYTHLSLRNNTVRTTDTLTDLNYRQVLDNLAMFSANAAAMPSFAVVNAGTVTVTDQKTVSASSNYVPTLTHGQQSGAGMPILSLLFNPSVSRALTENWTLAPVTDVDNLRRIRCAFQLLVLRGGSTSDCEHCDLLLERFYLGEADRIECLIPSGWYGIGCKNDVPKNARGVGHHGELYVWVCPEGLEGLTRFTMTVMDLATGKPHAPTRTVVQTFKGDGSLDNTQVTTTEIDWKALEQMKDRHYQERPRLYVTPPQVNPGLFFVPR